MRYLIFAAALATSSTLAQWRDLTNLGPPINTSGYENDPAIAEYGLFDALLVFSSNRAGGSGAADLWRSFRIMGKWQTPKNLGPNVNTTGAEGTPYFANMDRKLYFCSDAQTGGYGKHDIWWCWFVGGNPSVKTNVGPPINTRANERWPVLLADENTIYFASDRRGGYGGYDIWVSKKTGGTWGKPANVGPPINTTSDDFPHWLKDSGSTIVFSSSRPGGLGGYDIWHTWKISGAWQPPRNFGAPINSVNDEIGCSLFKNHNSIGGFMYFDSYERQGGYGSYDIWVVTDYTTVSPTSLGKLKALFY